MNNYIVYCICNHKNNKKYIGSTSRTLKKREQEHLRLLIKGRHYNKYLQEDYFLYSEEFEFYELCRCANRDEMLKMETYYMNKYGGIESDTIYNYQDNTTKNVEYGKSISSSNKGKSAWNKGRKMTPEEIEKNSRCHIGIKRSKESILKQKETIKQNPNFGNKGKHLSESTKQKISQAKKGNIPYNKGVKNKHHKYDELVPVLREEYNRLHSYVKVQQLHPDMRYDTIWCLIKYGDTNKSFGKCND